MKTGRKTVEDMQVLAAAQGGVFLGPLINVMTKTGWRCAQGHEWQATPNNIQQGKWCPDCRGHKRLCKEILQVFAQNKGGRCLIDEYLNVDQRCRWQCSAGHIWTAEVSNILYGKTWCPFCASNFPRSLQDLQTKAMMLGGKCLSKEYKTIFDEYEWECRRGHQWIGNANNVLNHNHWCRYCCFEKKSKPETALYQKIKALYSEAEQGVRGLLASRRLELDIWIPTLRKAIEFDGLYWHNSPVVRERDMRKDAECLDAGIHLLRIREFDFRADPRGQWTRIIEFLGS